MFYSCSSSGQIHLSLHRVYIPSYSYLYSRPLSPPPCRAYIQDPQNPKVFQMLNNSLLTGWLSRYLTYSEALGAFLTSNTLRIIFAVFTLLTETLQEGSLPLSICLCWQEDNHQDSQGIETQSFVHLQIIALLWPDSLVSLVRLDALRTDRRLISKTKLYSMKARWPHI